MALVITESWRHCFCIHCVTYHGAKLKVIFSAVGRLIKFEVTAGE